jgi:hypothetical protein
MLVDLQLKLTIQLQFHHLILVEAGWNCFSSKELSIFSNKNAGICDNVEKLRFCRDKLSIMQHLFSRGARIPKNDRFFPKFSYTHVPSPDRTAELAVLSGELLSYGLPRPAGPALSSPVPVWLPALPAPGAGAPAQNFQKSAFISQESTFSCKDCLKTLLCYIALLLNFLRRLTSFESSWFALDHSMRPDCSIKSVARCNTSD